MEYDLECKYCKEKFYSQNTTHIKKHEDEFNETEHYKNKVEEQKIQNLNEQLKIQDGIIKDYKMKIEQLEIKSEPRLKTRSEIYKEYFNAINKNTIK